MIDGEGSSRSRRGRVSQDADGRTLEPREGPAPGWADGRSTRAGRRRVGASAESSVPYTFRRAGLRFAVLAVVIAVAAVARCAFNASFLPPPRLWAVGTPLGTVPSRTGAFTLTTFSRWSLVPGGEPVPGLPPATQSRVAGNAVSELVFILRDASEAAKLAEKAGVGNRTVAMSTYRPTGNRAIVMGETWTEFELDAIQ